MDVHVKSLILWSCKLLAEATLWIGLLSHEYDVMQMIT